MASRTDGLDRLDVRRREQTPQALARLVVVALFVGLWFVLWLARIPMPVPFLLVLLAEISFFLIYWRTVFLLPSVRAIELAHYGMLAAEIVFHTTIVYFLGGISWLGAFAYVFGLIFANTFLDIRKGLIYTSGASLAFATLVLLDATGTIPHYVYLDQGSLRYADPQFVATTLIGGAGVFFSIYLWVNYVGHQLRVERDTAVRTQESLLLARAELERSNEALEERVLARTVEIERANAALKESEERFRRISDNAPDVIYRYRLRPTFACEYMSAASEAITGYTPAEYYLDPTLGFTTVHEDDRGRLQEAFLGGDLEPITVRCIRKDGEMIWSEQRITSIRDSEGELIAIEGIARDITERRRAEEALRESEQRLHLVVETSPDPITIQDTSGRYFFVNTAFTRVLGYRIEDMEDGSIAAFVHPDDIDRVRASFLQMVQSRRPGAETLRVRHRDGHWVALEANGQVLVDAAGEATSVVIVSRDVTERVKAAVALQESEEVLRATIESTADGIVVFDDHGQMLHCNSQFASMWGLPQHLLAARNGRALGDFVKDQTEDPEGFISSTRRVFTTSEESADVVALKDGRVFERFSRALFQGDRAVGRVWSFRDVTERRHQEEALRESESKFRTMAETVAAAVFIFQGTEMRYVNSAAEAITAYTRDELLGMNFWDVIHPDFRELVQERGLSRQLGAQVPPRYEVKIRTKNGAERWVDFTAGVIEFDGSPAVLGTAFDITERKRAEDALREQARRDPLTGLLNHAAIVEELRELTSAKEPARTHAVAMIDVDGLKAVNDTFGHQIGDLVLLTVARALTRDGARVGRYGGDEFVALLEGHDRAGAERYRDAVVDAVTTARLKDPESGASVPVVVSMGLAVYPEEAESIEELIKLSDNAMYAWRRHHPLLAGESRPAGPLPGDHAAEMIGELVPLLTSPGDLSDKFRAVAHRLSVGAGYDGVNFALFAERPGPPIAANTFARASDELIEAWNDDQRQDVDLPHPIRLFFEQNPLPLIMDDPWNDERLLEPQRALLRAAGLPSVLVAPMIWHGKIVGSLGVASRQEHAFTSRDAQFLASVATQVTAIVRMATLVEELQTSAARLSDAQTETVMLLASVAEARDQVTGRHLHNVRDLTEALAGELGYEEEAARELGLAAVLHDIGKIRVPDAVLGHPDRLREDQWELIKQHTVWGAELLDGRPAFELAATIARNHHERWDGTGYPAGLAGEALPEAAAIVAVADAFDAMVDSRPYSESRPVAHAVREIQSCSGKQFSPKVVDALARLYAEGRLPATEPRRAA
jgi:diguanylate cyclase (GGDEF)-like protein/PAS domain S-box-containing protein/putative nucleotidyltransferase with HDIG domain